MAFSCVQIQLVLGHKASLRTKRTPQGFTHDWEVFIRGPERTNIQNFVDKVVFYLHKDFQKPKRVVKEANAEGAYVVRESGYGCFSLPIEVYFKNKDEPRKVKFEYDLFLQSEGPPISHVRYEKMTFKNPSEDFRMKLIKGGGVGVINGETGTVLTSNEKVEEPPPVPATTTTPAGSYSSGAKKPPGTNDASKKHKSYKEPKTEAFNDLFGTPAKPEKVVGSVSVDAKKSSGRESSTKKDSLTLAKESKSSSSANSSSNTVKSDSKREKPDKAEKESKKENEKVSSKSLKEKDSEGKGDRKSRKEDKVREEKDKSKSSKEKSKKTDKERKEKTKDRDKESKDSKDKKDVKDTKDGKDPKEAKEVKENKDSRSTSGTKLQQKNEIKAKEIKEDPDVMRKMFRDEPEVRHKASKDDAEGKKSSREDKEKPKLVKSEPSKFKLDKMNDLFKDTSKSEKEKKKRQT